MACRLFIKPSGSKPIAVGLSDILTLIPSPNTTRNPIKNSDPKKFFTVFSLFLKPCGLDCDCGPLKKTSFSKRQAGGCPGQKEKKFVATIFLGKCARFWKGYTP